MENRIEAKGLRNNLPLLKFMSEVNKSHNYPKSFGFEKCSAKGIKGKSIDVEEKYLSDKSMANAFAHGIKFTSNLQTLSLRRTYMKTDSAIEILKNLSVSI